MGVLLVAPIASAGTQLWLYPKDHGPRQGGHVVPPGTFTLVIENRGKPSEAGCHARGSCWRPCLDPTLTLGELCDGDEIMPDGDGDWGSA